MYSAYVGVNGTATSWSRASSGSAAAFVIVAAAARRHDVRPDVAPAAADRRDVVARELRGAELQTAVHAQVRVALEQRAVVQRRRVALAVALERVRIAVRRDDRVHLDDAAIAGFRAVAAADPVQRRAAGVGHLAAVIERRGDAVVDPLEWHSRDIGAQNFLVSACTYPCIQRACWNRAKFLREIAKIQWPT